MTQEARMQLSMIPAYINKEPVELFFHKINELHTDRSLKIIQTGLKPVTYISDNKADSPTEVLT